jgi:hypothetical protein
LTMSVQPFGALLFLGYAITSLFREESRAGAIKG